MAPHSKKKKKKIFRNVYHEHLLGAGATRKLPIVLSLPNNIVASHRRDSEAKKSDHLWLLGGRGPHVHLSDCCNKAFTWQSWLVSWERMM